MESAHYATSNNWQKLLSLGEELLKLPDAASLCEYVNTSVKQELDCQAFLWLAEPFYPLPGERPVLTIPSHPVPLIVEKAYQRKKPIFSRHQKITTSQKDPDAIALPVVTQENLLGILEVERAENQPFTTTEIEILKGKVSVAALAMQVNRQVALKNWRYDQLSLVRSVSSQIANVTNLDELCKRVTNLIQCSFDYYHVSIFTVDQKKEELKFRASSLECEPNVGNPLQAIKFGEGLVGTSAVSGKEMIVPDIAKEPLYRYYEGLPLTKAEVVLPLVVDQRVLGVLDIQSDKKDSFHENDILVLRSLADNIALAVEGASLYSRLETRADQMAAVAEIGYALSSILDLDVLLKEVVSVIQKRFSIPFVYIFTIHSGRRKVVFQAGSGVRVKALKANSFAFELDSPIGIIPLVARTGKALMANDVSVEPLYKPSKIFPRRTKAELAIPLNFGNDTLGVLDLQSDQLNHFDQNDLDLFESLASGIALSIRNARLFRTERWRRSVSDSFRDIAGLLSANLALPDLLDHILTAVETNLPCDASAIWLLDNVSMLPVEERPLRLAAVRGIATVEAIEATEESMRVREYLNTGMSGDQVHIRKPSDPYGPLGAACRFKSDYSSIAVPLRSGEEIFGVLTFAHRASGRYGTEASAIALTLANYAAVAIQNARLYTSAQEEAWSSTVLLQVAEAIQSITTLDGLLSTMVRLTPLLVGIDRCAIYLTRFDNESFELKKWYGFQPTENEMVITDTDSIAMLKLKATLTPVFLTDPSRELGLTSLTHSEKSGTLVLLPLIAHGDLQGGFLISHNSDGEFGVQNRFSDQTLAILQGIAQQTSVGLENIRLVENRQEEAYVTAVLLQVAQAVVSQNKLDDILDTIVHLMPILIGVDTCVIYIWDKNNERFIPSNAVASTHEELEEIKKHSYSSGEFPLLDTLIYSDSMIGCNLEKSDFPASAWKTLKCIQNVDIHSMENSNWLFGFPLSIKGEKYGVMLTRATNIQPAYYQKRIELIKGVAQQTALAIQNDRLKEEMVGRERVEREFQLARQIQKTFLPQSMPSCTGWEFDLRWRTAREVGGDFYDVFETKDGRIALVIADVSDKGMPAALYMTVTRTLIRSISQSVDSPDEVLSRVNELLVRESQDGMFVTCIYALLDTATGRLEYANAGHNLPILYRGNRGEVDKLLKGSIALGVIDNAKYKTCQINIGQGDTLLFYTDGVTESFSSSGEQFTEDRLLDAIKKMHHDSAHQFLQNIEDAIDEFRKGEPASDDLTMIAIHRENETPA